jgi:hypothetical protein
MMPLILKKTIIAFTFSWSSMNCLHHSRTHVRDITLSPYTPFNRWTHSVRVFSVSPEISDWLLCRSFILVTNPTEQHNMVTLKQSSEAKPLKWTSPVFSIREASRTITYHLLPTPTSFHGRVRAIPLFYSRTSYVAVDWCSILLSNWLPLQHLSDWYIILGKLITKHKKYQKQWDARMYKKKGKGLNSTKNTRI